MREIATASTMPRNNGKSGFVREIATEPLAPRNDSDMGLFYRLPRAKALAMTVGVGLCERLPRRLHRLAMTGSVLFSDYSIIIVEAEHGAICARAQCGIVILIEDGIRIAIIFLGFFIPNIVFTFFASCFTHNSPTLNGRTLVRPFD